MLNSAENPGIPNEINHVHSRGGTTMNPGPSTAGIGYGTTTGGYDGYDQRGGGVMGENTGDSCSEIDDLSALDELLEQQV